MRNQCGGTSASCCNTIVTSAMSQAHQPSNTRVICLNTRLVLRYTILSDTLIHPQASQRKVEGQGVGSTTYMVRRRVRAPSSLGMLPVIAFIQRVLRAQAAVIHYSHLERLRLFLEGWAMTPVSKRVCKHLYCGFRLTSVRRPQGHVTVSPCTSFY